MYVTEYESAFTTPPKAAYDHSSSRHQLLDPIVPSPPNAVVTPKCSIRKNYSVLPNKRHKVVKSVTPNFKDDKTGTDGDVIARTDEKDNNKRMLVQDMVKILTELEQLGTTIMCIDIDYIRILL